MAVTKSARASNLTLRVPLQDRRSLENEDRLSRVSRVSEGFEGLISSHSAPRLTLRFLFFNIPRRRNSKNVPSLSASTDASLFNSDSYCQAKPYFGAAGVSAVGLCVLAALRRTGAASEFFRRLKRPYPPPHVIYWPPGCKSFTPRRPSPRYHANHGFTGHSTAAHHRPHTHRSGRRHRCFEQGFRVRDGNRGHS